MSRVDVAIGRGPGRTPDARDTDAGAHVATLHIDWTRCDGRGLCTELLPELLGRDEWGYPLAHSGPGSPVGIPAPLVPAARDAVALCPRAALRLG